MEVTAVVLNWRRPDETIGCVRSLQQTAPGAHVIVVDNASGDDSVRRMQAELTGIELIQNDRNAGYAGGNNAGIARALQRGCDAVLILNNDVIVRPGCVQRLSEYLRKPNLIVAPVSLKRDDPSICDFWRADVDLANLAVRAEGRDQPWRAPAGPVETDYVTGSAFMISAPLLRLIGVFDERFFLVWEELDLCVRARRRRVRPLAIPDAEVLHGQSVTFGGADSALYRYFYIRNSFLILDKHVRRPRRGRARAMIERRYRGGIDKADDPSVKRAIERGLEDGLARRFGPPPADVLETHTARD